MKKGNLNLLTPDYLDVLYKLNTGCITAFMEDVECAAARGPILLTELHYGS